MQEFVEKFLENPANHFNPCDPAKEKAKSGPERRHSNACECPGASLSSFPSKNPFRYSCFPVSAWLSFP